MCHGGSWEAWRREKIKNSRSSFTVLIKFTGNYATEIALIVSSIFFFSSFFHQLSPLPPFHLIPTVKLNKCLSGKHLPPQRQQHFNDLSRDLHWNTHYLLQTLHFNSHFHLETEGSGLEMLMNKKVIIDSQFLLFKQLRAVLIFCQLSFKIPQSQL